MRILGLDYGSKTVGVAISDPFGWTAQGLEIIRRENEKRLRKTYARIEQIIAEYEVTEIILGYPIMLSGDEGERVEKCKIFKADLERRTGLPVIFRDERLTTVEAYEIMTELGIPQVRARVIQHEQAQREAGHRIAQHRDHAAQCDDSEIPRPQR